MRPTILTLLFLSTLAATAQDKPETKAPKPLPTVSLELKAKLFKAQSQAQTAQSQLEQTPQFKAMQQKQAEFQKTVDEIITACGGSQKYGIQLDDTGDPVCVAKPEAPKESKK
jgi:hypothetical protein